MHQHVKMSSKHAFQKYEIITKTASGNVLRKKLLIKILQDSRENIGARVFLLINLLAVDCNFIKKRLWHMLFCVFCKIFKNTFL